MDVFDRYYRWVATCCIANSNSFFLCFRAQGFETPLFPLFPGPKLEIPETLSWRYPKHSLLAERLQARRKHRKKHEFPKNWRTKRFFENCCFFRCFAAFSARLHTLGKQREFRLPQTSGPGNRGKLASEGWNFGWRAGRRRRAPNQNLNLDLYRGIPRNLSFSIGWISGMCFFSGNCHMYLCDRYSCMNVCIYVCD